MTLHASCNEAKEAGYGWCLQTYGQYTCTVSLIKTSLRLVDTAEYHPINDRPLMFCGHYYSMQIVHTCSQELFIVGLVRIGMDH